MVMEQPPGERWEVNSPQGSRGSKTKGPPREGRGPGQLPSLIFPETLNFSQEGSLTMKIPDEGPRPD